MLGIEDGWISAAYVLCLVSSLCCVVFGAINWNRGDEPIEPDDAKWVQDEKKISEEL